LVWTDDDREKALAYAAWHNGFCSGCGTRDEWWDPSQGGDRFAFVTETRRCPGCELKEQEREQIPSKAKGIHISLVPNIQED
jgi:hypothetical protein